MSALILGLVTSYLDPDTSSAVTVRVASAPYADDNAQWWPRIVVGSDPEIRTAINAPWSGRRATSSYGAIDLANSDGALDAWMNGSWTGRAGELRLGYVDEPWTQWSLVAIVRLNHPDYIDGRVLRLNFRDRIEDLDRPIQQSYFDSAPNAALNGQRKPIVIGQPWHLPALLYDEASATELYFYVADNAIPAFSNGNVREGLNVINLGTGAGQYQDWPQGFRLNSQPTLPVTAFFSGPRFQPWPLPTGRFVNWAAVSGYEVPESWADLTNYNGTTHYARRRSGTDLLEVLVDDLGTTGWVYATINVPVTDGRDYELHWRAVDEVGIDNFLRLTVYSSPAVDDPLDVLLTSSIDFLAQTSVTITVPDYATSDTAVITLRFRSHQTSGSVSALFAAIWLEDPALPADTIDQLVPWLVCERGILDSGSGDETGPMTYAEIDHAALQGLAATLDVKLGHYWQDDSSHRDLLDLLFGSMDAVWWIDRQGRLTGKRFLLSADTPVLEFDDTNRITRIDIAIDAADKLTDSFVWQRNYRPVGEGEAAASVNEAEKASSAREYRRQERANLTNRENLHPDYRFAIGAESDETAITAVPGTGHIDRANDRLVEHAERIWLWRIDAVLTHEQQAALALKAKVRLTSERLGLSAGKDVEVVDIRWLPVSGRVLLIARG